MGVRWSEMSKMEKILWIVSMLAALGVILLSILQLCDVLSTDIPWALPMLGIMLMTQGAREWKRSRSNAIVSFAVALFIIVCAAVVVFLK